MPSPEVSGSPPGESPLQGPTALQDYWNRVCADYAASDPLAAVCYPGAPRWLNRFFAALQWRTVTAVLKRLPLQGRLVLDVGCGFGRWSRWLAAHGAQVIGVDSTEGMLQAARRLSPGIDFRRMSATALPFADESVDAVTCITVIQHLEPAEQLAAVAELCRVVRPGGYVIVLDLIDLHDRGKVVHPRSPEDWIACYERHGMRLAFWRGQEFVPLIRAFRRTAEAIGSALGMTSSHTQRSGPSLLEATRSRAVFRLAYAGLWVLVQ